MKITKITLCSKTQPMNTLFLNPELGKRNVKVAMGRIIVANTKEYDYKGYHIRVEEDIEPEENMKKWFYVSKGGTEIIADIGPYEPDETIFLWIDANCPSNPPHGKWDKTKLIKYIQDRDQYYQNAFAKNIQIIKIAENFKKVSKNTKNTKNTKKLETQNSVNVVVPKGK